MRIAFASTATLVLSFVLGAGCPQSQTADTGPLTDPPSNVPELAGTWKQGPQCWVFDNTGDLRSRTYSNLAPGNTNVDIYDGVWRPYVFQNIPSEVATTATTTKTADQVTIEIVSKIREAGIVVGGTTIITQGTLNNDTITATSTSASTGVQGLWWGLQGQNGTSVSITFERGACNGR